MKTKLLYFYPNDATFVRRDLAILNQQFEVKTFLFKQNAAMEVVLSFIKQFFFLLYHFKTKKILTQFGGYQSFLPSIWCKCFNKQSYLILGGTDCASFPEIGYGNYRKKVLGYLTKKSIALSKHISPVHKAMIDYSYTYFDATNKRQGFLNYVPECKAKITPIGYGFAAIEPVSFNRKIGFVTIAGFNRDNILQLKGLDLIMQMATFFPDLPFFIIGAKGKYVHYPTPKNVKILPFLTESEKLEYINQYAFYFQISISEGFPNALCETMAQGMIPIVSDVCSMPDIVSDAGFVLKKRDHLMLKDLIEEILTKNIPILSQTSYERIKFNYPPQNREHELLAWLME